MNFRITTAVTIALLLSIATCGEAATQPREVYEWLKQLQGDWSLAPAERQEGRATASSTGSPMAGTDQVGISFKLVGRGSTLQENLLPGNEREMATMYHCLDSGCSAVRATHYCAKKNQPEFLASMESTPDRLVFECDMSTELCQSDDAHIHRITHELSEDGAHLRSVYTGFRNGQYDADTIFHFERK